MGSLRSLKREASTKTKRDTTYQFFQEIVGKAIKIPLSHPDYHFISIERDLSDPISMQDDSLYYPNETLFWQVREIEFRLSTYIGFTLSYISLRLKIKVPTRSEVCWDGFQGYFSKEIVLAGDQHIKKYYRFRDDLKTSIIENGLLGLYDFPDGWKGFEVK